MPGAFVPALMPGRWPLILWAMKPGSMVAFMRGGKVPGLYCPPRVGMFAHGLEPALGLAGAIGVYLDETREPVRIAPPVLAIQGKNRHRARIEPLGREWTLPATEAVGVAS